LNVLSEILHDGAIWLSNKEITFLTSRMFSQLGLVLQTVWTKELTESIAFSWLVFMVRSG
jgi:hypothetical protein